MTKMLVALAAGVLVCVGVAAGIYLLQDTSNASPKGRSAILNSAEAEGVISGYRRVVIDPRNGEYRYEVDGGEIHLRRQVCGWSAGPCIGSHLFIDYRHTAEKQAKAILKIAEKMSPKYQRIIFGPPYYP